MLGWILFQFYIGFILGLIKKSKGKLISLCIPKYNKISKSKSHADIHYFHDFGDIKDQIHLKYTLKNSHLLS